jgi:putative membrane protein
MVTGFALATLNAVLNGAAATLMLLGVAAIKQKRTERHKRFMIGAFVASCLFLTSYLTRRALYGEMLFGGEGPLRYFYLALLASHVLLAVVVAPMVITSLVLGLRSRFATHKKVAKLAFPIWTYVSVTGVLVYLMLYHLPR